MINGNTYREVFYERVAKIIHVHRKKRGFTGEVLGERIGVSKATITGYEHGKTQIPGHMLYSISKELDFEFSEFDPDIPPASEIIRKIAEYKRKKRGLESFQVNFMQPGSARDIFNASASSPIPIRLMTEHRQFLDDYFSGADLVKQKSLEMLNVMMRQYLYYQDMSRNSKSLFDRALDVVFEDKDKNKQMVIIEIRNRYEI